MRRLLIFIAIVCTLSACASSPPQGERSEFEDIPVPKGLELDSSRSTLIESPTIKAARLLYKGRITPDSLAVAFRSTLETNGWRHLSTRTIEKGTAQVYESPAGVPVTSPRTMTRSPATSTSLISNLMSGMDLAKPPTTLIDASRPQHSPGR